jgi:DNA-binding response OmpR family regulator
MKPTLERTNAVVSAAPTAKEAEEARPTQALDSPSIARHMEVDWLPIAEGIEPGDVLVADPDESLLEGYRRHLPEDFELATATNGMECLASLRERTPDVLVLEPQLLWGGGDGVLAVMHQVFRLACVPVMILTACREVCVLQGVAAFRISDYCAKPLAPRQLATRIWTLLHLRAARRLRDDKNRARNIEITSS